MKCTCVLKSSWWIVSRCTRPVLAVAAAVICIAAAVPAHAQSSRIFTEWALPTAGSEPLLAEPVDEETVFFTERTASQIGKLDIEDNDITEWALSSNANPHELIPVGNRIFFAEQRPTPAFTGALGALDPTTGQLTEWTIASTAFPFCVHLVKDGKYIYFTEAFADRIGRLDPTANGLREEDVRVLVDCSDSQFLAL